MSSNGLLVYALTLYLVGLQCSTFAVCNDSPRFDRRIAKAVSKLERFSKQDSPKILIVDGYNLRGMNRFGWSHVELQCRVEACRQLFAVDYSVVVWDHGSCPFSIHVSPGSILLFSGLSQRADDVIVKEVDRLFSLGQQDLNAEASIVVVTNDVGLTDRLRTKNAAKTSTDLESSAASFLTMDSTSFLQILGHLEPNMTSRDQVIHKNMEDTKHLIYQSRTRKRGGFGKREKTWERAVLAESLRRSLLQYPQHFEHQTFMLQYVQDLASFGGYFSISSVDRNSTLLQNSIPGPARLDKHQKRAMGRFNSMNEKYRRGV